MTAAADYRPLLPRRNDSETNDIDTEKKIAPRQETTNTDSFNFINCIEHNCIEHTAGADCRAAPVD